MAQTLRRAIVVVASLSLNAQASDRVDVLVDGDLSEWRSESFAGETRYERYRDGERSVVRAHSAASASAMFRAVEIDLTRTPVLVWRWRVDAVPDNPRERERDGDDFVARVYVVDHHPLFFWRTRAVNYVWASRGPEGGSWSNPYAEGSKIIAVRSGGAATGEWRTEKRNVREDFLRMFGDEIERIDAVAIMTDTDNTAGEAGALYGDIYFTSE